jgi:hypothetical protein
MGTEPGANDEDAPDLTNVLLHKLTLLSVESSFPVTIGLNITGVDGKHFTKTGEQFAHVVLSQQKWSGEEHLTKTDDELVNSDYLQKYPGMTIDNLRTKNIVRVPDEQFVFVDSNHPVVEMLEANSEVLQINITDAELIDGRWYKVNNDVFEDCASLLDRELLQNLPLVNLDDFKICASRTGNTPWDCTTQACANAGKSNTSVDMILTRDNTLSIQFAVEYGFM